MIRAIKKRDGREVPFDLAKIAQAMAKAFAATGRGKSADDCGEMAQHVVASLEESGIVMPTVEQIQDQVETELIRQGHVRTAKAFILYRAERTRTREMNTRLMKTYDDITFKRASDSDIKRENANIDGDTAMGAMLKYGSEGAKQFYEMMVLNPEHARAHRDGDIHIHDLDFFALTTTCCQIDLRKLFKGGFFTGHGFLREPKSIASYAALACIAIQSNQNDQHGGQSIATFDYDLSDGVRKTFTSLYRQNMAKALSLLAGHPSDRVQLEKLANGWVAKGLEVRLDGGDEYRLAEKDALLSLGYDEDIILRAQAVATGYATEETEKATFQAMEALIHNLNTMNSRAGAQTPFSSINFGMDSSPEGRMVTRNVLLAVEAGLGFGETPVFPISIFRVKAGVNLNPGDPNYDLFQLACRVSAKRMYPNFAFQDAPFNLKYYDPDRPETQIAYMGCRTRVIGNTYDPMQEISTGRGNLSFTSINLPRLAIKANGNVELFFELLDHTVDLIIEQLMERFEIQAKKTKRNYPFLMGTGVWLGSDAVRADEPLREVLKHGTLSLGFIGLAETLVALIGEHHGQSERAQNLGLEIVGHMRARMDDESTRRGMNFTLLATPAEGLSGRFVRIDQKAYGTLPGITDRDYYTNSFHIPVYFPISATKKILLEAPYHVLTNAGHITYVEMDGDPLQNLQAFEDIIRLMNASGVGYGSINHPVDRDSVCGYNGIIGDVCPGCGRAEEEDVPFERIRRITGYLVGTLDRFNDAKRAEERERVKHAFS